MTARTVLVSERGFSFIELAVVMVAASVILAILLVGVRQVSDSFNLQRAANLVVSQLRYAQARAMAEGVDYTVEFYTASGGIRIWKSGVSTALRSVLSPEWPDSVEILSDAGNFPNCASAIDASHDCAVFKPLGYAEAAGDVVLHATGSGSELTVVLEAASGRVRVER
ncbi:MAG TPA: GspH/FimT family pseudopilin [bacterium]